MKKAIKIVIAIIAVFVIIIGVSSYILLSNPKIQANVYVNDINISGLTKDEAKAVLENTIKAPVDNLTITSVFQDRKWQLSYKDIGFMYNIPKTIDKAYDIGRTGSIFDRLDQIIKSKFNDTHFSLSSSYNEQKLNDFVNTMEKEINQDMVDATITYKKPDFIVTDDVQGQRLNKETAFNLIKAEIEKVAAATIELPVEINEPTYKKAELANVKDVLGAFSTKFNAGDTARTENVKLGTKLSTDILLMPGQIYSLNKVIGPILSENGFKLANTIVNDELVPGIGGGICQVSSTLYNAALLSNLKIVERRNHSLPSTYVALGRDATISGSYIDLKFENSSPYPIYIYGEVIGNWVKFTIFGRNDYPERKVSIETQVVKVIEPQISIIEDPTLPEGTEVEEKKAHTGYEVKSYRIISEAGKVLSREFLFNDRYRVVDGVKRVGTKIPDVPTDMDETPINNDNNPFIQNDQNSTENNDSTNTGQ